MLRLAGYYAELEAAERANSQYRDCYIMACDNAYEYWQRIRMIRRRLSNIGNSRVRETMLLLLRTSNESRRLEREGNRNAGVVSENSRFVCWKNGISHA